MSAAVLFAIRPDPRKVETVKSLSIATVLSVFAGIASDLAAVGYTVPHHPEWSRSPNVWLIVLEGFAESMSPAIFGFSMLSVVWMIMAVGHRAFARSCPPDGKFVVHSSDDSSGSVTCQLEGVEACTYPPDRTLTSGLTRSTMGLSHICATASSPILTPPSPALHILLAQPSCGRRRPSGAVPPSVGGGGDGEAEPHLGTHTPSSHCSEAPQAFQQWPQCRGV